MDLTKEEKEILINSKLKALNGKLSIIGTEEDFGESEADLLSKIEALTNALKMI